MRVQPYKYRIATQQPKGQTKKSNPEHHLSASLSWMPEGSKTQEPSSRKEPTQPSRSSSLSLQTCCCTQVDFKTSSLPAESLHPLARRPVEPVRKDPKAWPFSQRGACRGICRHCKVLIFSKSVQEACQQVSNLIDRYMTCRGLVPGSSKYQFCIIPTFLYPTYRLAPHCCGLCGYLCHNPFNTDGIREPPGCYRFGVPASWTSKVPKLMAPIAFSFEIKARILATLEVQVGNDLPHGPTQCVP